MFICMRTILSCFKVPQSEAPALYCDKTSRDLGAILYLQLIGYSKWDVPMTEKHIRNMRRRRFWSRDCLCHVQLLISYCFHKYVFAFPLELGSEDVRCNTFHGCRLGELLQTASPFQQYLIKRACWTVYFCLMGFISHVRPREPILELVVYALLPCVSSNWWTKLHIKNIFAIWVWNQYMKEATDLWYSD